MILPVVTGRTGVGELAGALDEVKPVVVAPRLYVVLAHKIERAYQLHARIVRAVELGHHRLYLRTVEHSHEYRLDNIVVVVTERYLVAAELLREFIKISAAHPRAEIARRFFYIVDGFEYVRLEYVYRDVQRPRVVLDYLAVLGVVSGIHDEIFDLEIYFAVSFKLLKELRHEHRVLAAGYAYRDPVALVDEFIYLESLRERTHYRNAELFTQALLDLLTQFAVLPVLHLIAHPREISALEAVRLVALLAQPVRNVYAENSVRAVDYYFLSLSTGGLFSSSSAVVCTEPGMNPYALLVSLLMS